MTEAIKALSEDAVEVGSVVDAYGVKGWLKIAPHAGSGPSGGALLRAKVWWLVKGHDLRQVNAITVKAQGAALVAQFAGCEDRDQALALRGFTVYVRRVDFPALGCDEYYWVDLIGLTVINEAGDVLGSVAGLIDNGAHAVLRVQYACVGKAAQAGCAERLIPFVDAYVKTVDQVARHIIVDWGLDY